MLPLESMSVVDAEQLQAGDLAVIHELSQLAIVGRREDQVLFVVLDKASDWAVGRVADLSGYATKILSWELEADPSSVKRLEYLDRKSLALSTSKAGVGVIALPPSKVGHLNVIIKEADGPSSIHAFDRWRIIHRIGDRTETLFERIDSAV